MSRFDECIEFVFQHEGGYSNKNEDRGGQTKYGITAGTLAVWDKNMHVRDLTKDVAKEIYKAHYWDKAGCDHYPAPVDLVVLDAAVHAGVRRAVLWLQKVTGASPDGVPGPNTYSKVSAMDADEIARLYIDTRRDFLEDLCERDARQMVFYHGWMNRLNDLERASA